MIKLIAKWILKNDIKRLNDDVECQKRNADDHREMADVFRKDVEDMEDCKLKLRIAEMYAGDDDALLEIFAMHKEKPSPAPNPAPTPVAVIDRSMGYPDALAAVNSRFDDLYNRSASGAAQQAAMQQARAGYGQYGQAKAQAFGLGMAGLGGFH